MINKLIEIEEDEVEVDMKQSNIGLESDSILKMSPDKLQQLFDQNENIFSGFVQYEDKLDDEKISSFSDSESQISSLEEQNDDFQTLSPAVKTQKHQKIIRQSDISLQQRFKDFDIYSMSKEQRSILAEKMFKMGYFPENISKFFQGKEQNSQYYNAVSEYRNSSNPKIIQINLVGAKKLKNRLKQLIAKNTNNQDFILVFNKKIKEILRIYLFDIKVKNSGQILQKLKNFGVRVSQQYINNIIEEMRCSKTQNSFHQVQDQKNPFKN